VHYLFAGFGGLNDDDGLDGQSHLPGEEGDTQLLQVPVRIGAKLILRTLVFLDCSPSLTYRM
jgi:hypothetical protein